MLQRAQSVRLMPAGRIVLLVKTGDIGRLDANGYLYMLDRADDMVTSASISIQPS